MIFNSIRWRLQAWHGLILVAVLAGFGLTAYQVARDNQLRRIDQALDPRLMALLRPPPPERRPDRLPGQSSDGPLEPRPGSPRDEPRNQPRNDRRFGSPDFLFTVREQALRALEALRNDKTIKANLEARVSITASGDDLRRLQHYSSQLAALFVVSQVDVKAAADGSPLAFTASKAEGGKCERCWNYSTHVGENKEYPTVCERCSAVLQEIG